MNKQKAGALLREVARLHDRLQRQKVTCCGTTETECRIITELGRSGPMTLADMVRRLGVDKGWLSRTVDRLVQDHLVMRSPGTEDKRTVILALTAAGQQKYAELNDTLNDLSTRVMERLPENEQGCVLRALELLHRALAAETGMVSTTIISITTL